MKHHVSIARLCLAWITVFLSISLASASQRGLTTQPSVLNEALGTYHALIIGINQYREWNPLQTAVKDAVELRNVLVELYGFDEKNVVLRTDEEATRLQIISDLRKLAANLGERDNLLVYFAGHGQLDDLTGDGYWIPVEGRLTDPGTWISQATIKGILGSEKARAKNVVVIADSCYSGTLLRGGPSILKVEGSAYLDKIAEAASKRSRQVITSGGLEPVADGGRDGHSLFAYYLIKALRENDREVIDLENLFHTRVWEPVTQIGGQRPNVGRLKTPMDEDGQFVLINHGLEKRKAVLAAEEARKRETMEARVRGDAEERERLEAERRLLEAERRQLEEERRLLKERKTLEAERLALEKEKQLMAIEAERKRLEGEKARIGKPVPEAESAPRITSIPAPAVPAPAPAVPASGTITVAVLPWRFESNLHNLTMVKAEHSFDVVLRTLSENRVFVLTHSAYSTEETAAGDVHAVSLSPEEDGSLWVKKGAFSSTTLNTEAVAAIGRRLGVDLVLMLRVGGSSWLDLRVTASIIDTHTGQEFTETRRGLYSYSYTANLTQMTQNQLQQYLREVQESERKRLEGEKARIGKPVPEAESAPRVTSIPAPAVPVPAPAPAVPASGRITVAVLPWRFEYQNQFSGDINATYSFDIVLKALSENPAFGLTHSTYSTEETAAGDVHAVSLSHEEDDSLWVKKGFFSNTTLNTEAVAAIGRRLGVDLVLMLHTATNETFVFTLIETNTGRSFTDTQKIQWRTYLGDLAQMTQKQLQEYLQKSMESKFPLDGRMGPREMEASCAIILRPNSA